MFHGTEFDGFFDYDGTKTENNAFKIKLFYMK